MENNDLATIADLSDTELDMVAAGLIVSAPTSININVAVPTQVATNVAAASANTVQTIFQGIGLFQVA